MLISIILTDFINWTAFLLQITIVKTKTRLFLDKNNGFLYSIEKQLKLIIITVKSSLKTKYDSFEYFRPTP